MCMCQICKLQLHAAVGELCSDNNCGIEIFIRLQAVSPLPSLAPSVCQSPPYVCVRLLPVNILQRAMPYKRRGAQRRTFVAAAAGQSNNATWIRKSNSKPGPLAYVHAQVRERSFREHSQLNIVRGRHSILSSTDRPTRLPTCKRPGDSATAIAVESSKVGAACRPTGVIPTNSPTSAPMSVGMRTLCVVPRIGVDSNASSSWSCGPSDRNC